MCCALPEDVEDCPEEEDEVAEADDASSHMLEPLQLCSQDIPVIQQEC